jgi:hypothetical protein
MASWYDDHTDIEYRFDVPQLELNVTDPEPVLYGPDGEVWVWKKVKFGFQGS